jgi:signal transduction histidine kinase
MERRALETVYRNELRLLKLVNSLLEFSRIEAGRSRATYQAADLSALTADLASTFRSAIERGGLRFEVDCPPLPEPAFVDPEMWEKIVLNLLSNAFKFTLEGSVRVGLRAVDGQAVLTVEDSGVGIPVDELPRVFERFHRIEGSRSRTHEGSGIGLALVQDLVRLHGGTIDVASRPDHGATFTVRLPLGSAHLDPDRIGLPAGAVPERSSTQAFVAEAERWLDGGAPPDEEPKPGIGAGDVAVARGRIVLADDNADMRDYLRRLLGGRWGVEAVRTGREALDAVCRERADLVITDVMMPDMDGFALLSALKADDRTRDIPVMMLSARAGEEMRLEGLQAGADDYLVKPFSARELLARVEMQLLRASMRAVEDRQRRQLEVANRTKDEFLAMLGHELRNPLAPILTALQLMRLRGGDALEKERTVIERQTRHLVRLVDDLLDVSRIARGKIDLRRERVDVADVVAKAIEMSSPLLEERQHDLSVDVPRDVAVDADPARLAQVFANLLTNSAKYTETGGSIQVTAERVGESVTIRVKDDGIGIAAEMLPHVFDMFAQERQALDRTRGGLGLGLTIVKTLTELHGGSVEVSSAGRGQGSEFLVRLPAAAAGATALYPVAGKVPAGVTSHSAGAAVLIVDDNQDAAEMLAQYVQCLGYRVRIALDGPSALKVAREMSPRIALLDIGLPVMDGFELAGRVRELPGLGALKLIAITGYGQETDRDRTRSAGFDAHMVKPVDMAALEVLLRSMGEPAP